MNYIKYLIGTAVVLLVVPLVAAPMDKTIFSTLEPHKTKTFELSVAKGKTLVSVNQSEDDVKPVLTCTFFNGNEVVTQSKVKECITNFVFTDEGSATIKVVNESNSTIDLRVRQFTVKK